MNHFAKSLLLSAITTLLMSQSNSLAKGPALAVNNQSNTSSKTTSSHQEETANVQPPKGTLAPITLKATLEKTEKLPLSLKQALELALGKNITIKISDENVEKQHLDFLYKLSDLLPDLVLQYTQSRFVGAIQIFGGQNISIFRTTYQPQLLANYTIYSGGKNIFEIKASKQREEAQKSLSDESRQDILSQVALAYYDLQEAYWKRAISLEAIKEAETQVAVNQARLESGVGVKLDLLQAQTFLSTQKSNLLLAEDQISKTSDHLSQLLNMNFNVDILPPSLDATMVRLVPEDIPTSKLLATAKRYNPHLSALNSLEQAANTDVTVSIADIFPQFDISAYIDRTGPHLNSLESSKFIGVVVSTNLLDNMGFGKPLQIKQAKTDAQIAQLNYAQADKLLEENLANIIVDLKTTEANVAQARETLEYAQEAYENALGRLKAGVGTNLDLETAMTNLTQARSQLATSFLDYNKNQVILLSNLGLASIRTITQGYQFNGANITKP